MDLYTLIVAVFVINLVFSVVYFSTYLQHRRRDYFLYWGISTVFLGVNGIFFVNAPNLSPLAVSLGTNGPMVVGMTFRLIAARNFGKRKAPVSIVAVVAALWFAAAMMLHYGHSREAVHTFSMAVAVVILMLATWEYWRDRDDKLISRYWLIFSYGAVAAAFANRVFLDLIANPGIGIYGLPDEPGQATNQLIAVIASCASAALCLSIAFEKIAMEQRQAAQRDFLTGAYNRRAFEGLVKTLLQAEDTVPLAVIHFDIDHFKSINDRFGHAAGDQALKHCTDVIQANLRGEDCLARLGGEEFGALLVDVSGDDALAIAERVRSGLENAEIHLDGIACSMTLSAGVIHMNTAELSYAEVMKTADQALYQAKNNGRNRVELGDTGPELPPSAAASFA